MKIHEQVVAEMMKCQGLMRPVKSHERYSMKELLSNTTPENIKELNEETQWIFEHGTIGREL